MKRQNFLLFLYLALGVLGIPGVTDYIYGFVALLEHWEWWNIMLVGLGGIGVCVWLYQSFKNKPSSHGDGLTNSQRFKLIETNQQLKHQVVKGLFDTDGGRAILIVLILGIVLIILFG